MNFTQLVILAVVVASSESDGSTRRLSDSSSSSDPECSVHLLQSRAAAHTRMGSGQRERDRVTTTPGPGKGIGSLGRYRQIMHNIGNEGMAYAADMLVGGQKIRGILDTGSYELLVFSARCRTCGGTDYFYNETKSNTHRPAHLRTMHSFGSGDTWSQLGYEQVRIGPLSADSQYFWEVVDAALPLIDQNAFSAIVGLGPPSTPKSDSKAQADHFTKLKQMMLDNPRMPRPKDGQAKLEDSLELANQNTLLENFGVLSFSVCIDRSFTGEGYFIWNDTVPDMQLAPVGMFTRASVIGDVTWGVHMDKLRLQSGGADFDITIGCANGCGVILDSGTSLITVPSFVAENALDILNRLSSDCSDFSKLPDLSFEIGGTTFTLPPSAYVGEVYGELPARMRKYAKKHNLSSLFRSCELLLMTMDVNTQFGPLYIMGMPFFREYYTTFDLGSSVWDKKGRSVHMAAADQDCQPALPASRENSLAQRQQLRRVDLSQVRLPKWVEQAAEQGTLRI